MILDKKKKEDKKEDTEKKRYDVTHFTHSSPAEKKKKKKRKGHWPASSLTTEYTEYILVRLIQLSRAETAHASVHLPAVDPTW